MGLKKLFDITDLLKMERNQIFLSGVTDKIVYGQELKWVAVRLSIDEWTIFYSHKNTPTELVVKDKRRLLSMSLIKNFVPGTPRFYTKYFL